jgi:hypothetical protein
MTTESHEIQTLTPSDVEEVSGAAVPAWLVALGLSAAGSAIYDGLKEAGVFKPIQLPWGD